MNVFLGDVGCSGWTEVGSRVPQGSILRQLYFTIFINSIGEWVLCKISKFADDTKIASRYMINVKEIRQIVCLGK